MARTGNGTFTYRGRLAAPGFKVPGDYHRGTGRSWLEEHVTGPTTRLSGKIVLVSGVLLALCSLLPWLDGTSGVALMFGGRFGPSGNAFFSLMNGMLYLSGAWPLALGAAAAAGGALRMRGGESGATLALIAAGLAAAACLVNVLMAYTRGAVYHSSPGWGLWLALGLSGVIIAEVLVARFPDDYLMQPRGQTP